MFVSSVQLWFFLLQSVVESGGCEHGRKGDLMKRAESLVSTRFSIIAILNFRFHFCNLNFCQRSAPQPSWTADGKWKERGSTAGPVQVDYIIYCRIRTHGPWDGNQALSTIFILLLDREEKMCQLLDFNIRLAALHKQYRSSRVFTEHGIYTILLMAMSMMTIMILYACIVHVLKLPALQPPLPWKRKGM